MSLCLSFSVSLFVLCRWFRKPCSIYVNFTFGRKVQLSVYEIWIGTRSYIVSVVIPICLSQILFFSKKKKKKKKKETTLKTTTSIQTNKHAASTQVSKQTNMKSSMQASKETNKQTNAQVFYVNATFPAHVDIGGFWMLILEAWSATMSIAYVISVTGKRQMNELGQENSGHWSIRESYWMKSNSRASSLVIGV